MMTRKIIYHLMVLVVYIATLAYLVPWYHMNIQYLITPWPNMFVLLTSLIAVIATIRFMLFLLLKKIKPLGNPIMTVASLGLVGTLFYGCIFLSVHMPLV